LSTLQKPTEVEQQVAGRSKVDSKIQKILTKTSKLMGQEVEGEVVGEVVAKVTELVDVASKTLQTSAAKKVALKNAKVAGVKMTLFFTLIETKYRKNNKVTMKYHITNAFLYFE
jgi:hypothetical protein